MSALDAVDKALLYAFQLSNIDYAAIKNWRAPEAFIRALEQDGFTVASLAAETDRDARIEEAVRAGLRLAAMAQEVLAGHRAEEAEISPGNHKCRECEQLHPCHAWTLAYEILHPLSPVGQ